jgi:hypothetical protein
MGVLILLTAGCASDADYKVRNEYLGEGMFRETIQDNQERTITTTIYFKDLEGRYNGMTIIKKEYSYGAFSIEEVNMQKGHRHGKSKTTLGDGSMRYDCYEMGLRVICQESSKKSLSALALARIGCL